jgi:NDP-sugar pyrophosphorylase family protein
VRPCGPLNPAAVVTSSSSTYASQMAFPKQAIILAAGQGTRLGGLGQRQAKVLVEIDGQPLLAHQLAYLEAHGISQVVVNASHLAGQVEEFAEHYSGPIDLQVVVEDIPLGTAGGVRNALHLFASGPLLVFYGDVIVGEDLRPLGAVHAAHQPVATLGVYHSVRAEEKGVVELSGSRVTAFHEKDPNRNSGWVNAGIYVVTPAWLSEFPDGASLDFGFDVFPAALASGRELRVHGLSAPVLDVGTLGDLERARALGLPDVSLRN